MIYDTPEQKQFVLEAIKKYPCNYENALQLANAFGASIQNGQIIPLKDQPAAKPSKAGQQKPGPEATDDPNAKPANRKERRTLKAVKKKV